jgi:putative SOS response-associated peptidase YedK
MARDKCRGAGIASARATEPAAVPQLKALLAPYPSDEMSAWPVSAGVGNVKNNDPGLIEPITAS